MSEMIHNQTAVYLQLLQRARENAHSRDVILTRLEGENTAVYGQRMSKWVPDHDEVWDLMVEGIRPLTMAQHLRLLEEEGFTAVDVLWKKQIFGLYIGIKDA